MTNQLHYVRNADFWDSQYICPCCKEQFDREDDALNCCQFENMQHIKKFSHSLETICGILAEDETPSEDEPPWAYEGFDINGYCHFCLREDNA